MAVMPSMPLSFSHGNDSEKAMAPHSSTLAWKIPWTEEPGRLQSVGSLELDTTERLHFHFSLSCIGEGNGNPLQYSCLENPRDGGACWAAVSGVAQSRTWLKWFSSMVMIIPENTFLPSNWVASSCYYVRAFRIHIGDSGHRKFCYKVILS